MSLETEYKAVDHGDKSRRYFWRQLFVCLTVNTFYFMIGLTLGSPTVALPQLKKEANATASVSIEMASWINSIVPYSAVLWVLVLIIAAHYFGRRKPMIVLTINSFCAYIVFYYSKDVFQLFTSQLIQGLTQASFTTTSSMVVLEYTTPSYRGLFLGFFSATHFWGIWVANTIGTFVNYRYIGLVGIGCTVYTFLALMWVPESPHWLACQGRYDECAKVHRWLKGVGDDAEKELNALISSQTNTKNNTGNSKTKVRDVVNKFVEILKDPEIYKPMLLVFLMVALYQFCGKLACAVYAVEIMKKIARTESQAYMGVLILDGFSVAGMYMGSFISRYFLRRTLIIVGSVICAIFLFLLSFYLFLVKLYVVSENTYISLMLLVGFSLAACIGPIIAANQTLSELYPVKHRTFAMCMICVVSKLIYGSVLKITPYIFKEFQVHGAFLVFAISFSICIALAYLFVPETKDKSVHEISEIFARKDNSTSSKDKELKPLQSLTVQ